MQATFVLIHGAWHGGWCYARVADLLRERGHLVFTPSLTGLGDRADLASNAITLTTHITDIVNLLNDEDLHGVVLCGHSYGGMVISGVVEAVPERIGALVFLDAFVPQNGQSLHDIVPEAQRLRQLEMAAANAGFIPPIAAAHFNVNEADRPYVDEHCTPQPFETMRERLVLTGARDRVRHKTYLRAAAYPSIPFEAARTRFAADPTWVVAAIEAGHDVMLDNPVGLAEALLAAAHRAGLT
jgi:pimeloyl-ACP methyl ester carboxylesterase